MHNPFETVTHAKRTYRELRLLMYLNHSDAHVCTNESLFLILIKYFQVVQLFNVFTPDRNLEDFRSLYVHRLLLFVKEYSYLCFLSIDILYSILLVMI